MLLHDAYHLFCQVFGGKEEPGAAGYFAAGLNFAQSGLPVYENAAYRSRHQPHLIVVRHEESSRDKLSFKFPGSNGA